MNRTLLFATLSLVWTFTPVATRGASITYNIQNYPSLQNGLNFSGTVTTDGAIGLLSTSDITAWSFTISNGAQQILLQATSQTTGASTIASSLIATSTQLSLAPWTSDPPHVLVFRVTQNGLIQSDIEWSRSGPPSSDAYEASGNMTSFWGDFPFNPPGLQLGGSTWIVATAVPEPGTLTLALLGIACLAVVQWTRRRCRVGSRSLASLTVHT